MREVSQIRSVDREGDSGRDADRIGIQSSVPSGVDLEQAVDLLKLLADPTRLEILILLGDGEASVGEIAEALDRSVPATSQHLAKLRAGHLVISRREGTTIVYAHATNHVGTLVTNVLQHAEHVLYPEPPHHD